LKASPFSLVYGREARLPIDLVYANPTELFYSTDQYADHVKNRLEVAYELSRLHALEAQDRQKSHYDQNRDTNRDFDVGRKVWLFNNQSRPGQSSKFHKVWLGPFVIVDKTGPVNYRISMDGSLTGSKVVHVTRLKRHLPEVDLRSPNDPESQSDLANVLEDGHRVIEKIIKRKRTSHNGSRQIRYLVKWRNFASKFNTWEPESSFESCQDVLENFKKRHPARRGRPPKRP